MRECFLGAEKPFFLNFTAVKSSFTRFKKLENVHFHVEIAFKAREFQGDPRLKQRQNSFVDENWFSPDRITCPFQLASIQIQLE